MRSLHSFRDQKNTCMSVSMHRINTPAVIPVCRLIEDIRAAWPEDAELQMLHTHTHKLREWPHNKENWNPV